jgi:hypothetical protein
LAMKMHSHGRNNVRSSTFRDYRQGEFQPPTGRMRAGENSPRPRTRVVFEFA